MAWGWISGLLASHPGRVGLFEYLACRDRNRTRIKLEDARREATNDLIDRLPYGAVYRETARDCRREIWMPSPPQSPLLLSTEVHHESGTKRFDPGELQAARTLGQDLPLRTQGVSGASSLFSQPQAGRRARTTMADLRLPDDRKCD